MPQPEGTLVKQPGRSPPLGHSRFPLPSRLPSLFRPHGSDTDEDLRAEGCRAALPLSERVARYVHGRTRPLLRRVFPSARPCRVLPIRRVTLPSHLSVRSPSLHSRPADACLSELFPRPR